MVNSELTDWLLLVYFYMFGLIPIIKNFCARHKSSDMLYRLAPHKDKQPVKTRGQLVENHHKAPLIFRNGIISIVISICARHILFDKHQTKGTSSLGVQNLSVVIIMQHG